MSRLVNFVRDFIRKMDIKRHLQNLNIEKNDRQAGCKHTVIDEAKSTLFTQ